MATSFGALSTDFYLNQKLRLKMDLPSQRDTVLHLFDHLRKAMPKMTRFRRYEDELSLESSRREAEYTWLALRQTSVRTGHVNPQAMAEAYKFHRLVLEVAPFNLSISPLDVDYLELLYGFDLECKANHDEVVYEALFGDTPLGNLLRPSAAADGADDESDVPGAGGKITDVQPMFGMTLTKRGNVQANFEIKTRTRSRRGATARSRHEPISLFLTVRNYGPVDKIADLLEMQESLSQYGEALVTERLIPDLLTPISRQIMSSSA